MKKSFLKNVVLTACFTLALFSNLTAQNALYAWSGQYGGTSLSSSVVNSMIKWSPGVGYNIYTCGQFSGTIDFNMNSGTTSLTSNGGDDIFVACQDYNGIFLWVVSIGGNDNDSANIITQGPDEQLYIGGSFANTVDFDPGAGVSTMTSGGSNDGFVLKLDVLTGNYIWAVNAAEGNGHSDIHHISFLSDSSIVAGGNFDSSIDTDPGAGTITHTSSASSTVFVTVLNYTSTYQQSWSFNGTASNKIYGLVVNNSNEVIVNGYYEGQFDLDPGAGTDFLSAPVSRAMFIARTTSAGVYLSGGMLETHYKVSMVFDGPSYRLILSGAFTDSIDYQVALSTVVMHYSEHPIQAEAFLFMLSSDISNCFFHFSYGGSGDDIPSCMGITDNQVIISGSTTSLLFDADPEPQDSFVITTNANDIYAIVVHDLSIDLLNCGIANNLTSIRSANTAITHFEASGPPIYLGGGFTATSDFDPYSGTTAMTSAGGNAAVGYLLRWGVCSTVYTGTSAASCDTIYMHNNIPYPVPGQFSDTLQAVCGSDSIVVTNLYLYVADTSVNTNSFTLTVNQSGQLYQWVDCSNGFTPINGANSQSFSPAIDGSYAVIVSNGTCYDTSGCHTVLGIGVDEKFIQEVFVQPNPFSSQLSIAGLIPGSTITMYNVLGEVVLTTISSSTNSLLNTEYLPSGSYLLVTEIQGIKTAIKLIK